MEVSPIKYNEDERIAALYKFQILDTGPEKDFDDIVNLASHICQVPIATVCIYR